MQTQTRFYGFPFFCAVCLHVVVLVLLVFELSLSARSSSPSSANIIQAVAMSQQSVDAYEKAVSAATQAQEAAAQQAALQHEAELKAQALLQQQLKTQQLQAQQQKLQAIAAAAKAKAEQEAAAEASKAKAAQEAAMQTAKVKAAQEAATQAAKAKVAQEAAAQAAKAKASQAAIAKAAKVKAAEQASQAAANAKQQADARKLQQAIKQGIQNELTSDQSQPGPTSAISAQSQGMIDKYKALIIQSISQQWIVPPHLQNNMVCELEVRVAPGGVVLQATVIKSSGNTLLDNSAIAAVNKASPLPVPNDPGIFDQFRELHLTVKPDGTLTSS